MLPLRVILLVAIISAPSLHAGNALLTLEKSTNSLKSWQMIPLTPGMLTLDGRVDAAALPSETNSFFRMRVVAENLPSAPSNAMIQIQGGTLPDSSYLGGQIVQTFSIAKYEVTWSEWASVRSWAATNGYDLGGVGEGEVSRPVQFLSWEDAAKWCNARSEMEGLPPVYRLNGAIFRSGVDWSLPGQQVTANLSLTGYRLPTEAEWEWAARGGVSSADFTYSGGNNPDDVAWFWGNSPGGTRVVGTKGGNELGLHDMSGNVEEWTGDLLTSTNVGGVISYTTISRGGSWLSKAEDVSFFGYSYGSVGTRMAQHGLRVARSLGN